MYSSIYRVQSSTKRLPIRALFGFTLKQLNPIPPSPQSLLVWWFVLGSPWVASQGNLGAKDFASVVVDGYTWFSLLTIEIHVWTCKDRPIDVDDLDSDRYAYGVCHFTFLLWLDCYTLTLIRHSIQPSNLPMSKAPSTVASHFSRRKCLGWKPSKQMKRCTIIWKHGRLLHSWTKNHSQLHLWMVHGPRPIADIYIGTTSWKTGPTLWHQLTCERLRCMDLMK